MSKEFSRRTFLERIGLGTVAGASLSLMSRLWAAPTGEGRTASVADFGTNRRQSFDSGIRMRQPLSDVRGGRQGTSGAESGD